MSELAWLRVLLDDGPPDQASWDRVRRGFRTWLRSATSEPHDAEGAWVRQRIISVQRCCGLPENPKDVRRMLRDDCLRAAAQLLPQDLSPWRRSCLLHEEARRFAGHQWICWLRLDAPPEGASEMHKQLWRAMVEGGGELPEAVHTLHRILRA